MEFKHTSVLLNESIELLNIKDGGIYVDGTLGGGGHSEAILKKANCSLIGIDRDEDALRAAGERLKPFGDRVTLVKSNFSDINNVLDDLGIEKIDGCILDLGVSSYQLDNAERGFSYMHDAPLDMRMDTDSPLSAYEVVNEYSEQRLKKIIFDYGEERFAPKIAAAICRHRELSPIKTTHELTDIIKGAIPAAARVNGPHPAKRTFQAIRIEVNSELDAIEPLIKDATNALVPTGRIAIISFHSLEDRIVKQTYKSLTTGCTCPKDFPVCICGNKPKIKDVSKKPILPSEEELEKNPRSRSATLRVAEKL